MSDRLQEFRVFVRAAESGSFSRAGRELGLSQPSVSRIIGELEARLGVTLLLRSTRRRCQAGLANCNKDLTLLLPYRPTRGQIVFRVIPGVV